jgi:hypothetical protein
MKDPVRKSPHAVARASKVIRGTGSLPSAFVRSWMALDSLWDLSGFRIVRNK